MSLKIVKTFALDFTRNAPLEYIFVKAGDKNSRVLDITPLNSGLPYQLPAGVSVVFMAKKPDKTEILNDATVNTSTGHIEVTLSEQTLAAEGILVCEVALYNADEFLSSQHFYLKASPFALTDVESSNEYNSLVVALLAVDEKVREAEEAIEGAEGATAGTEAAITAANNAASLANQKAALADEKASLAAQKAAAAETAAGTANSAASAANTAKDGANAAATLATEKASLADAKATEASRVNISATATETGADITVTDREGVETTVHIDTLTAVKTWADVRNAVRLGIAAALFPVGYEFTVDRAGSGSIVFAVRGHNHHTAANGKLAHTMTLEMKNVYGSASAYKGLVFDATEALYYAENGLAAGTYNFTVANQAWYTTDNGKTYQFTLVNPVPAGGQIVLSMTYNATLAGKSVKTYSGATSTAAIETATLTEGSAGTSLGTTDGTGNMNHMHRAIFGSNNYAQSALRQWLNSAAAVGSVWTPQTVFDRPPSWHTTTDSAYAGFMNGLDEDFLSVVEPAVVPCLTNSVYEKNSLDGTEFVINQTYDLEDKFFLLSRPEMYGTWDSTTYKDGELLEFYDGLTNTERKKFDSFGSVRRAWLRSPYPGYANYERFVNTDGTLNLSYAIDTFGAAAACIIA